MVQIGAGVGRFGGVEFLADVGDDGVAGGVGLAMEFDVQDARGGIGPEVAGLLAGDALNIRSGPGVIYPTVISLQNGINFLVIGAAKMNGSDAWLPCIKVVNWTDPATGASTPLKKQGWINNRLEARRQ